VQGDARHRIFARGGVEFGVWRADALSQDVLGKEVGLGCRAEKLGPGSERDKAGGGSCR
jgi:hypothetical protein